MKHKLSGPSVLEKNNEVYLDTLRFEMRDLASANLLAIVLARHTVEVECVCAQERSDPVPAHICPLDDPARMAPVDQVAAATALVNAMNYDSLCKTITAVYAAARKKGVDSSLDSFVAYSNSLIKKQPMPPRIDPDDMTASKIRAIEEAKP